MYIFELILVLLFCAALLSMVARHLKVAYPTMLALGGVIFALFPGSPELNIPPELILALFVAPVLLDAAYDTSLRELRKNFRSVSALVLVVVSLTTVSVAIIARYFIPEMPWGVAIALGALLAPPDAVAALAVMQQVAPPRQIRTVLEGESLLNDASSLLIYKLAVSTVLVGNFSVQEAVPTVLLVTVGSFLFGWVLAKVYLITFSSISDAPTATIIQFVMTFGVWIIAEHLGLSSVVTVVVFGLTSSRKPSSSGGARVRILSNATWEVITFVLNVLAFVLIGLQLKPLLKVISNDEIFHLLGVAFVMLCCVITVRLGWILMYGFLRDKFSNHRVNLLHNAKTRLMIGWSGMRGIVTLAAALALPMNFPYRDFILITAFTIVLGTLIIQGLTLRPLLIWLNLPNDNEESSELKAARTAILKAITDEVAFNKGDSSKLLYIKMKYQLAFREDLEATNAAGQTNTLLKTRAFNASRKVINELRESSIIGDNAYRAIERELDLIELTYSKE